LGTPNKKPTLVGFFFGGPKGQMRTPGFDKIAWSNFARQFFAPCKNCISTVPGGQRSESEGRDSGKRSAIPLQ